MPRPMRQRAAWANDHRMAQVPLGLRAPPQLMGPQQAVPSGDACSLCKGSGHKPAQCPNHIAKKDEHFKTKSETARNQPCHKCKGVDHWGHHHESAGSGPVQKSTSSIACRFHQRGKCRAGAKCKFLHELPSSSMAVGVSQNALTQNGSDVCNSRVKFGVCKRPTHNPCKYDHPNAKKGKNFVG